MLSTRAKTLQAELGDRLIFIGPMFKDYDNPLFTDDTTLYADWAAKAADEGLTVRVGRWNVPGNPVAVLVDFVPFFEEKDRIYAGLWEDFHVDSLHAYGDYDEASMFSYAAAKVVESFYRCYLNEEQKVVYHGNEWMLGLGVLYINKHLPEVATVFTTHATSIGRSIAGNNKPLYEYLWAYNGDQMAGELNMQSKHSIEKQTALYVDCFTTVSDITANECKELLDKPVDFVLPNGFENDFVPKGAEFTKARKAARQRLLAVANALTGKQLDDDTLIVSTSGRYEFRNKGIDVYIEALNRLRADSRLGKKVLAFITVPAWVGEPRPELVERLQAVAEQKGAAAKQAAEAEPMTELTTEPLAVPMITHWLHDMCGDNVLGMAKWLNMQNAQSDNVTLVFVPCYLDGQDGVLNMKYYDLVLGNDLCVYPSYYEPWGYTPLEAVAFKVPCITTDLAGFGLWANTVLGREGEIADGVKVIHRTDYNYSDVADGIKDTIVAYSNMTANEVKAARAAADKLSKKALWSKFIAYYRQAYDLALAKAEERKQLRA